MKRWLSPIHLADETQTRIANILQNLILMTMLGLILGLFTYTFLTPLPYVFWGLSLIFGVFGLTIFLARKGYLSLAGLIFVCSLLGAVTYFLYRAQNGIRDEAIILYPVIVMIAGIVLTGRSFFIALFLTIASVGLIVYSEMSGLIATKPPQGIQLSYFLSIAIVLIILAASIRLMAKNLYTSLAEVQKSERALAKANQELEQRVRERTAQLETSYEELKSFSYTVSHNLRTPLRGITGYAGILMEESQADLTPIARHYLVRISHNADLMGQFIDDLLAYLNLAQREIKPRLLDPAETARLAWDTLKHSPASEIHIHAMPPAHADPDLLERVYLHLLENAIKFTQHQLIPLIEVGVRENTPPVAYYVRDNGIGLDMQYAPKIFGVFERLHLEEEYEGTGIGLSIVHRILEKHGGRIWVESAPGMGATFYFTLQP